MKVEHIDHADELDRFARESKRGNGVLIGAYDGLTLAAVAKELRALRANAEKIDKLLDAWIWDSPGGVTQGVPYPGFTAAWIPSTLHATPFIDAHIERFVDRGTARAAIRRACGLGKPLWRRFGSPSPAGSPKRLIWPD